MHISTRSESESFLNLSSGNYLLQRIIPNFRTLTEPYLYLCIHLCMSKIQKSLRNTQPAALPISQHEVLLNEKLLIKTSIQYNLILIKYLKIMFL